MGKVDLRGKRALVTGGNKGIGLAAVRALAAAGADVEFTARSAEKLRLAMAALGDTGGVRGHVCDVTDCTGMAGILAKGVDILVNNAGVIGPIGRIVDLAVSEWQENLAVNLVGSFHAAQQAIKGMVARRQDGGNGGVIVNLSSGAARRPLEGWSAYCAGKAGLAMLTRSIHEEYGDQGVRVYGFAPGVVDTDMQAEIRASGLNPVAQLPQSSLADAAEPGQAIAWLCTDAAMTWRGLEVDIRDAGFRVACGLPPLDEGR